MNLEFSEDQKFVQHTAREFLTKNAGLDVCRKVLETKDATHDPGLWKGVAEMGWLGAAVPEAHGGAGLGHLELVLIAEEIGRALAPIPFASSVALCTEAILQFGSEAQKQKWLPRLAAGEAIGTFALAEGPGDADVASLATRFASGRLTGTKLPVLDGEAAGLAVVVAQGERGPVLALLDLSAKGVTRTRVESFDPSHSLARLELRDAGAELLGGADGGAERVATLLDRAAVVIGFEQLGGATRALEITREFALGRYAFGRPIASFQALKHRLADLYAKIEIARSNGYYAAWALSSGNDELALAACSFRAAASDAFESAAQEMIQIHGGVGFTWEYDCHLFYRRARWLAASIGTASSWRDLLITRLVARQGQGGGDAHAE
ncbi:MAG: acyl-CoA/acyl-ACP dehydrogenase [Deltaproteobacteria bacterium]|nr:acyl-CoA/acyl-ACP dehydrogenase [Deltaproteobacteria bacterium]